MEFYATIKELGTGKIVHIDFPTSLEEVAAKLGLEDDRFEYIIVDSSSHLISEHDSIEMLNRFYELAETTDDDLVEAVHEVLGYKAKDFVAYDFNFEDCSLLPDVNSQRELGEYWVDQLGFSNIPREVLEFHFDHEGYGRDIDLENQGGFSSKGYLQIN
ncbi:antirestriction protein ArdA [Streptococcus entericus]|uniref:antirestriction protein ArdA n=1 Tax=Streptococcus entericus TaxID=155680 RepID=UPI000380C7F9|nr:antirestriction protein ArdA [Streptococcus entericus]